MPEGQHTYLTELRIKGNLDPSLPRQAQKLRGHLVRDLRMPFFYCLDVAVNWQPKKLSSIHLLAKRQRSHQ
jgi:hypothetical protein